MILSKTLLPTPVLVLSLFLLAACAPDPASMAPCMGCVDEDLPSATSFVATATSGTVNLTWGLPAAEGLAGAVVRWDGTGFPTGPAE